MSAFLYVTRTIRLPVRAVGSLLLDSDDNTVATCGNSMEAVALSVLANYGSIKAREVEAAHDAAERKKASMFKGPSPWSYLRQGD
jgi:hypothetical protein